MSAKGGAGNPANLSDGQMFQMCAAVLETHAESIFVYAKEGRRLIADLRRRSAGEAPPVKEDVEDFEAVSAATGETIVRAPAPRHRSEEIEDGTHWLPAPIPGRINLRLSSVDDAGMVADMEFGNASIATAEAAIVMLVDAHAADQRRRKAQ